MCDICTIESTYYCQEYCATDSYIYTHSTDMCEQYIYMHFSSQAERHTNMGSESHPRQLFFSLGKVTALGVLCCFALLFV